MAGKALVRLILQGSVENQVIENVLHYGKVGADVGTGAAPGDLAAAWVTACGTQYLNLLPDNYNFDAVIEQGILALPRSDPFVYTPGQPAPGTAVGDPSASFDCAQATFYTGNPSRSTRGRVYVGPLSEDDTVASRLTTGYLTRFNLWATAILGDIIAGSGGNTTQYNLSVYSRELNLATFVTSCVLRSTIKTQRRRLVGRGI